MRKAFLIFTLLGFTVLSSANSSAMDYEKEYDKLIIASKNEIDIPVEKQNDQEEIEDKSVTWSIDFENNKLPNLYGTWILKKKSIKRKQSITTARLSCDRRFPFAENKFEKEVVISPKGEDFFFIRSLTLNSNEQLSNPTNPNLVDYQYVGLQGVAVPNEITYAYILSLKDHIQHPGLARKIQYSGKVHFYDVSKNRIAGKGYEMQISPECDGYALDEISFELERKDFLLVSNEASVE